MARKNSSKRKPAKQSLFHHFARIASEVVGSPAAFIVAAAIVVIWGVSGPLFHYSDTWQLVINTSTTIVTFLMVFLIQNTQNRDSQAMHLKLDELVRALSEARNDLVDIEDASEEQVKKLRQEFEGIHQQFED